MDRSRTVEGSGLPKHRRTVRRPIVDRRKIVEGPWRDRSGGRRVAVPQTDAARPHPSKDRVWIAVGPCLDRSRTQTTFPPYGWLRTVRGGMDFRRGFGTNRHTSPSKPTQRVPCASQPSHVRCTRERARSCVVRTCSPDPRCRPGRQAQEEIRRVDSAKPPCKTSKRRSVQDKTWWSWT